tara:strand:- start:605 stop:760 length:156 start_codon:yes stop_codon:yes gene_type:complete
MEVFRCAICDKMTSTENHIIAKDFFPGFDYYICNKHRDKEIEGFRKENARR